MKELEQSEIGLVSAGAVMPSVGVLILGALTVAGAIDAAWDFGRGVRDGYIASSKER